MTTMATIDRTGRRRIRRIPITRAGILKYYPFLPLLFFGSTPSQLFGQMSGKPGASDGGSTSPAFYALAIVFYLIGAIGAVMNRRNQVLPGRRVIAAWGIVVFIALSFGWSVAPALTLRRAAAVIGMTFAATHISTYPPRMQLRMSAMALGFLIVTSLAMWVVVPDIAVANHKGTLVLQGVYTFKNELGWIAALAATLAYWGGTAEFLGKTTARTLLAAAILAAIGSGSATGILGVLAGILATHAIRMLRAAGRGRALLLIAMIVGAAFAVIFFQLILPVVLDYFGKSGTLSGRTVIWRMLVPAIKDRLLLGWGFGAFWDSPISFHYVTGGYWAGNAQGGYVEILVSMGVIGTILYLGYVAALAVRLYKHAMLDDRISGTFLALLIVMSVIAVASPLFTAVNQIYWILIVMAGFYEARKRPLHSTNANLQIQRGGRRSDHRSSATRQNA